MKTFRACPSRIIVATVCGIALVHLVVLDCNFWCCDAKQIRNRADRWAARYEPLCGWLPDKEVSRFMVDRGHVDRDRPHPDACLYLARYAVVPKRLSFEAASGWVVVDSDRPDRAPAAARTGRWTLVVDLHNGVRLYRIPSILP